MSDAAVACSAVIVGSHRAGKALCQESPILCTSVLCIIEVDSVQAALAQHWGRMRVMHFPPSSLTPPPPPPPLPA